MITPKDITIFVPTFGRSTLEYCLESIRAQSETPDDVVVIRDRPIAEAMGIMLKACNTPFFIKADDDFMLHPNALRRMLQVLNCTDRADLAMQLWHLYDVSKGEVIESIKVYRTDLARKIGFSQDNLGLVDVAFMEQARRLRLDYVRNPDVLAIHGSGTKEEQVSHRARWKHMARTPDHPRYDLNQVGWCPLRPAAQLRDSKQMIEQANIHRETDFASLGFMYNPGEPREEGTASRALAAAICQHPLGSTIHEQSGFCGRELLYPRLSRALVTNAIEVGTLQGHATAYMALACRENGGKVYSVDIRPKALAATEAFLRDLGLLQHVELILGKSEDVLPNLAKRVPFQAAYIDADHSFACSHQDFDILYPAIRRDPIGIVILDDVDDRDTDGGVQRTIRQIREQGLPVEVVEGQTRRAVVMAMPAITKPEDLTKCLPLLPCYDRITARSSSIGRDMLFDMFRKRGVKTAVEVGTYQGHTTAYMALAVQNQPGGMVYSVDINPTHQEAAGNLLSLLGLSDKVQLVLGASSQVLPDLLCDKKIDAAFIDGLHSYEAASSDFWNLYRAMDPAHILIVLDDVDDIHPEGKDDGGVPRLITELRAAGHSINTTNKKWAVVTS